jgi:hypothetical protein
MAGNIYQSTALSLSSISFEHYRKKSANQCLKTEKKIRRISRCRKPASPKKNTFAIRLA